MPYTVVRKEEYNGNKKSVIHLNILESLIACICLEEINPLKCMSKFDYIPLLYLAFHVTQSTKPADTEDLLRRKKKGK